MQLDLFDTTDYEAKDQAQKAWQALMIPADWIAPIRLRRRHTQGHRAN